MNKIFLFLILATLASCGKGTSPLIEYFLNDEAERYLGEYNNQEISSELEVLGVHTTTTEFDQASAVNMNQAIFNIALDANNNNRIYFLVNLDDFPFKDGFTPSDVYNFITSGQQVWSDFGLNTAGNNTNGYRNTANSNDATEYYFTETSEVTKDLELMGAKVEALQVSDLEDNLINYGLSTERAETLGKLMNSYSKIKNKRGLTAREKDVFTKELTGLSFDRASEVLVDEGYDALIDRASDINGADPEAIKELLNEVL